jgi:hypothetical protein
MPSERQAICELCGNWVAHDPSSHCQYCNGSAPRPAHEPPAPLSMLDALRLAKETPGLRVRPISWRPKPNYYGRWIEWKDMYNESRFVDVHDLDSRFPASIIFFGHEAELLGPWEVVQ